MFDEKSGSEIIGAHFRSVIAYLPACRRTGLNGFEHGFRVNSHGFAIGNGFAYSGGVSRNDNLVCHFHMLSRPGFSFINDIFSHSFKNILAGVKRIFITADHNGERCVFSADIAAGNRRVKSFQPFCLRFFINAFGKFRAGSCHIDKVCMLRGIGDNAMV